ncbi:MAG TPA: SRPBCC domain-containing protein [Steroidobacteraceae bacterium]|nr:SRPBCC domain-containing protein [Steroidobacteraceae bacterium]
MPARAADRSAAGAVRIERVFAAPRELVFEAWTKPEYLLQWYAPRGCTIRFEAIDVRPGGRFHSCIHNPAFGDCWCVGVYREIVRPERIVYTLATADSAGNEIEPAKAGHDPRWPRETLVTVTFEDVRGATKLTLEQNVLESLAKHTGAHPSWLEMLDRLAALVATRNDGDA